MDFEPLKKSYPMIKVSYQFFVNVLNMFILNILVQTAGNIGRNNFLHIVIPLDVIVYGEIALWKPSY